jgi:Flp pilus assembly protein TadB
MALSEQDKRRIREEEVYRLQVREEHRQSAQEGNNWKTVVFWIVLVAVAVGLYVLVRRGSG